MKFLKPYRGGYLYIQGNGKAIFFDKNMLLKFNQAYEDICNLPSDKRTTIYL